MATNKKSKSKPLSKKDLKNTKGGMLNAGNLNSPPASTTQQQGESYTINLQDPNVGSVHFK